MKPVLVKFFSLSLAAFAITPLHAKQNFSVIGVKTGESRVLSNFLYRETSQGDYNQIVNCNFFHAVTSSCNNLRVLKSCEIEYSNITFDNQIDFPQGAITFCADEADGDVKDFWDYNFESTPNDGHSRRPPHDMPRNNSVTMKLYSTGETINIGHVKRDCAYTDVDSGERVHVSDCWTIDFPLQFIKDNVLFNHHFNYKVVF